MTKVPELNLPEPNLDNPTTPSSTGLRNQIGKYFWCSRMDCNEGHIMYCDDETDQYYELDQCKCNQGVEEILALIANQVREARIDELERYTDAGASNLEIYERIDELKDTLNGAKNK